MITICSYSCHLIASDTELIVHQEFRILVAMRFPKLKQNLSRRLIRDIKAECEMVDEITDLLRFATKSRGHS